MVKNLEDTTHQNTITEVLPGERVHKVPLDQIEASNRIRQVDASWARIVADSFLEVDQLQPIDLMKRPDGTLELVDGKHRLRAAELLGWEHISAHVRDMDGETVRLRQIDANLIRRELSPLDRAAFLAARKDHYEMLYPDTKKGGDRGNQHTGGRQTVKFTFSQDAAEKTGLSRSTIEKAIWLDQHLCPVAKQKIQGTEHANKQSALMALARLDADTQIKVADLLTRDEKPARTVKVATDILIGVRQSRSQREIIGDRFIALWEKSDAATHADFLRFLTKGKLPKGWEVSKS